MKLTDQSQMPFGKFEGYLMEKVPADYLLYLWDVAGLWDKRELERLTDSSAGAVRYRDKRLAVHDYIRENFSALETECKDRIITHRP